MQLSEEQKQDIYLTVAERFDVWYVMQAPDNFNGVDAVNNEVFKPAGVNIFDLKSLTAHEKLEKIIECCQKLRFSNFDTWSALDAVACDASLIFNIQP